MYEFLHTTKILIQSVTLWLAEREQEGERVKKIENQPTAIQRVRSVTYVRYTTLHTPNS